MRTGFAIPASFIINTDMTIYWKSISDQNFQYRPDPEEMLEKIRELKSK